VTYRNWRSYRRDLTDSVQKLSRECKDKAEA
jgi:hypothetical protein